MTELTPEVEEAMINVRLERDQLLRETDCIMLPDYPINEIERQSVIQYRQYLRDYTKQDNWWEKSPLLYYPWTLEDNEAFFE